jgi:hypothetical protein
VHEHLAPVDEHDLDRLSEILERLPRHADCGGEIARNIGRARAFIRQGLTLPEHVQSWFRKTLIELENETRDTSWQDANR